MTSLEDLENAKKVDEFRTRKDGRFYILVEPEGLSEMFGGLTRVFSVENLQEVDSGALAVACKFWMADLHFPIMMMSLNIGMGEKFELLNPPEPLTSDPKFPEHDQVKTWVDKYWKMGDKNWGIVVFAYKAGKTVQYTRMMGTREEFPLDCPESAKDAEPKSASED